MNKIQIIYALPERQDILEMSVEKGTTVQQAIQSSGILTEYPELDLTTIQVGIFSKKVKLDDVLNDGDRVEIYRPLEIDPKTARIKRVKK